MAEQLYLTDGTTTIYFIGSNADHFHIKNWDPSYPSIKGGGYFQDPPNADGRTLISYYHANAVEEIEFMIKDATNEDDLASEVRGLMEMINKANSYWASAYQEDPVYLVAQGRNETNARYAKVKFITSSGIPDPYTPLHNQNIIQPMTLSVEREHWRSVAPGSTETIEVASSNEYDGRTYGEDIPNTSANFYVANKAAANNLTDVYHWDDNASTFSTNLLDTVGTITYFPSTPAVGDAVYFGIDSSLTGSSPFSSIVFNLNQALAVSSITIIWEYYSSGAWTTMLGTSWEFDATGYKLLGWDPSTQSAWQAVNPEGTLGVTGWFVRARISAISGFTANATQNSGTPYTVVNPWVEIVGAQAEGDLGAALRLRLDDGVESANRAVISMRSTSRGSNFTPYIDLGDQTNPSGISITAGGIASITSDSRYAASGEYISVTTSSLTSAFADIATIALDSTIAGDYSGIFRAFLRSRFAGTPDEAAFVKLRYQFGSGGYTETDPVSLSDANNNDRRFIDLGPVFLNVGEGETVDAAQFKIRAACADPTNFTAWRLADLILMPVDEWSAEMGSSADGASYDSIAGDGISNYSFIDSVNPSRRRSVSGKVYNLSDEFVTPIFMRTDVPLVVPHGNTVRIYFMFMRSLSNTLESKWNDVHQVTITKADLYSLVRGSA